MVSTFHRLPLLGLALVLLLVGAVACGDDEDDDVDAQVEVSDVNEPPSPEALAQVVAVEYTGEGMQGPDEIGGNMRSFRVKNSGDMEHGFAIRGDGIDEVFDDTIAPGEEQVFNLEQELAPGTYELYDPNATDGSWMIQVTVQAAR